MSVRPNNVSIWHRLVGDPREIVRELTEQNKDKNDPVAIKQWHQMYQQTTQDCWDRLNPVSGGPKLINLYCLNRKVPESIEMLIHQYHFGMVKIDLDMMLRAMKNKVDVHSSIWANRMSAAHACVNDQITSRYFQLNMKMQVRLWSLDEIQVIIYRHLSVRDELFDTYLLNFQRRVLNCTCGVCTGTWNTVHGARLHYLKSCTCTCVLCDKKQYLPTPMDTSEDDCWDELD